MNDKNQLRAWDYAYVWHPFTQMKEWLHEEPLFIARAEGNYLFDLDGQAYFDGVSSLWANVHGHNHPHLNKAVKTQLEQVAHSTMLGLANLPATIFAKRLIDVCPRGLRKVFYSDTGAAANEIALKMAYQYWKIQGEERKSFISVASSYHGDTIGAVSLGGIELFHRIFRSLLFARESIPSPYFYRSGCASPEDCADESLLVLKDLLKRRHHEFVALCTESYVQGAGGMIVFPEGFMRGMRELCREYGVLFIVDEVATGFGRTGRLFACEEDDLDPDIMTLGKGISGGYLPLAATVTTDEIYNAFLGDYSEYKSFFHGHTYTGNPLATSVAIASLELFEKNNVIASLEGLIVVFRDSLESLRALKHVGDIRQKGMMVGIELVEDTRTRKPFDSGLRVGYRVCMRARKDAVIIRSLGDVLVLMPPLSSTQEELQYLVSTVGNSIQIITGSL